MRDASTKPSAATVLPAPVACSNQKRLAALGSSGCSSSWPSSSSSSSCQSWGSSSSGSSSSGSSSVLVLVVEVVKVAESRPRPRRRRPVRASAVSARATTSSGTTPLARAVGPRPLAGCALGQQRGQRARQRVDLVGGQHGAVDEVGLLLGEQPLQAEQQRELAPPLDRGRLVAGVDLGQRSVERAAAGGPGGQGLLERFAFVDEALARQQLGARDRVRTRKGGGHHPSVVEAVASG